MLLDAGGAAMRQREQIAAERHAQQKLVDGLRARRPQPPKGPASETTVVVKVVETHNDEPCDCIDGEERTLRVGDELTLNHICVDGRVDQVVATVVRFTSPTEHATATVQTKQ